MAVRDKRVDAVELGIDERLVGVRIAMFEGWATGSDNIEYVASLIRVAYAKGLTDALKDPTGTRRFLREHGFKVPHASSH